MKRFPSNVAGLDDILQGGLFEGGVYILEGPPGVGKTTLANQMAFNHADEGHKTLYVTMLAESHARMVQHMSNQSFFSKPAVNASVFYLSGYRELENEGLKGVLSLLRGELARSGATFLVIDGLVVSAPGIDEGVRQFVHELQSLVTAMSCTCLVLTTGLGNGLSAEQTMVDGIFAFEDRLFRGKAERLIQVRKFRGSQVVRGQHSFCITNDGLQFFPRLESLPLESNELVIRKAASLGVRQIDEALGQEGIWAGTTCLAIGESGTGKTRMALRFAAVAQDSVPALLLLGSSETAADARLLARGMGIDLDRANRGAAIYIEHIGQAEESLDEMGHKILRMVDEYQAKRLAFDGAAVLAETLAFQARGYKFLGRLLLELRRREVTSLFTLNPEEIAAASGTPFAAGVSALFDNVFVLESLLGVEVRQQVTVRKIRGPRAPAATVFELQD